MTDEELIDKYIEPNPNRPGKAEARVVGYAVPVWALVGYREAVHGDVAQVAHDYRLPQETVEAAVAYYHRYKTFIDSRLDATAG